MILIPVRVAPSGIHGLGLIAAGAIPAGTPVWRFQSGFDREFSPGEFAALPAEARKHIQWFAYQEPASGGWVLSGDHACFMNHSATPNTGAPPGVKPPVTTVALRDIAADEEITCDYFAFDAEAWKKLGVAPATSSTGEERARTI
ncbi:MAG TPA: SET domain-containing protein [Verrucomicrobiae bacterium]|nr:SET domain-containing protein [Verrucomicrobiae bacterium]